MYHLFNVLFDDSAKEEKVFFYKLIQDQHTKEYASVLVTDYPSKAIGSFLFDFVSLDFSCRKTFCEFVSNYCFEALLYAYYPYRLRNPDYSFVINEEDYNDLLNMFFNEYSKDFCYYKQELYDLINTKDRLDFFSYIDKTEPVKMKPYEYEKYNNVNIKDHLKNIRINFDYRKILNCNYKNIEFTYETDNFYSLLYLFMWRLTKLNNVVYVCKNCGKYFIPDFQYNSKYCNNIYAYHKTCREIAAQIQYKKKLDAEPVLKKCRTFYQTLQKNASLYGGKHIERYENFKKESKVMKKALEDGNITVEDFSNWIDSKKIRK